MKIGKALEDILRTEPEELEGYHIFYNPLRRAIFRELTRKPCVTSSFLGKKLGANVPAIEWHLKKLMSEDYIGSVITNKKLYYPQEMILPGDVETFSILNGSTGSQIMRNLLGGCKSIGYLQGMFSLSTLYRNLKALQTLGLVKKIRGRKALYCLTDIIPRKLEEYDKIGMDFKKRMLERISLRGYEVEIIGTYGYEVKLRIRGLENFTMGFFISPMRTTLEV